MPSSIVDGVADPEPSPRRRIAFELGAGAAVALLALLVAIDTWAIASTDPDFYLPDPFRPLSIALIAIFVASGFVRSARRRRFARRAAALLVVVLLILEANFRFRGGDSSASFVEPSPDVLLRYRYKAGATFGQVDEHGVERRINHLGLMDVEHAIPKPPDVFRVVVLSGSIANDGGVPFDARFWRVLERKLDGAAPGGRRVEVVNVSVHGYSEVQQVRLLEQVGLAYQPDVVVVGYMLTAASLQNGGYRRLGDSFFLFRFLPWLSRATTGSVCSLFAPYHERYSFDLIVRNSFERLALLRRVHGFRVLVAVLPVLEDFDDRVCGSIYDRALAAARDAGLPAIRVVDEFRGEPVAKYIKPHKRWDVCHPNAAGHEKIADAIARALRQIIAEPPQPGR